MNIRHIYIFQNKVCIAEENRIEKKSAKLFALLKMTKMCSNLLNWVKWSRLRNFPFFSVNKRERGREREREREVGMTSTRGGIPGAFYRREIETSLTICQTT